MNKTKPVMRNLCPYQVFAWHETGTSDRFTKEEFLESVPHTWDIEKWNEDQLNIKILIT